MLFSNLVAIVALAAPAFAMSSNADASSAIEKREAQRQAVARMALAKARAARRTRRAFADEDGLAERDLMGAVSKLVARSQPRARCDLRNFRNSQERADRYCKTFYDQTATKVSYDKRVAVASCVNSACQIACPAGYAQWNSDTEVRCIKNADMCADVTCTSPNQNTEVGCVDGRCTVTACYNGSTLNRNKTGCINLSNDPINCGTERNRCPASYDRKYNPVCSSGSCTFNCPRGFVKGSNQAGTGQTCVRA